MRNGNKPKKSVKKAEKVCCVYAGPKRYIGTLYIENERVLVLLQNVCDKADLGPLQSIRREHVEPEADILILPRDEVRTLKIVGEVGW